MSDTKTAYTKREADFFMSIFSFGRMEELHRLTHRNMGKRVCGFCPAISMPLFSAEMPLQATNSTANVLRLIHKLLAKLLKMLSLSNLASFFVFPFIYIRYTARIHYAIISNFLHLVKLSFTKARISDLNALRAFFFNPASASRIPQKGGSYV
jgi:hypothetical protein